MGLVAGTKVMVRQLGKGTVIKETREGAMILLDSAGLEVEMPVHDIKIIESGSKAITEPLATIPENNIVKAIKSLEALRFGLVPENHIHKLTMGYEELKNWSLRCFPESCGGEPRAYEITGPFGTGKSHTMTVIRKLAHDEGYLTARVEVDGESISLAEPDKLLNALWLNLTGNNLVSDTPLLDVYLMAIQKGFYKVPPALKKNELFANNYETIVKLKQLGLLDKYSLLVEEALSTSDGITTAQIKSEIGQESFIRKSEIQLRPVKAKRKDDRSRNFIESLAGHAIIAKAAGYKGLVVTIDEFEIQYNMARSSFTRVEELIRLLAAYLTESTNIPIAPLAIFFATVGQDGHLGDILIEYLIKSSGGDTYVLTPWSSNHRIELAQKIYNLYKETYKIGNSFDPMLAKGVEKLMVSHGYDDGDLIRMFIKWYLAMLDLKHGPGRHQGEYQ